MGLIYLAVDWVVELTVDEQAELRGLLNSSDVPARHCCIKAKGVLAVPQSGDAGPSDTLENRNKPGI
jgi:hypothetical protein